MQKKEDEQSGAFEEFIKFVFETIKIAVIMGILGLIVGSFFSLLIALFH